MRKNNNIKIIPIAVKGSFRFFPDPAPFFRVRKFADVDCCEKSTFHILSHFTIIIIYNYENL